MAEPKEGYNSGVNRNVEGIIGSSGAFVSTGGNTGTLASTDVDGSLTLIGTAIDVIGYDRIMVDVLPGAAAFTAFSILISADGTTYSTAYNTSGDFTTPSGILVGTSGDLTILGAATHGWFILDVTGVNSIQIKAQAGATSLATASWSAS